MEIFVEDFYMLKKLIAPASAKNQLKTFCLTLSSSFRLMTSIGAMTGVSLFTVSIAFGIGSKPWEILFLFFIVKA